GYRGALAPRGFAPRTAAPAARKRGLAFGELGFALRRSATWGFVVGGPWPPAASLREPLPPPRESAGSPSASWASPDDSERRSRAAMLGPADSRPAREASTRDSAAEAAVAQAS